MQIAREAKARLPILRRIGAVIDRGINECCGTDRVTYDTTSRLPGMIEWE